MRPPTHLVPAGASEHHGVAKLARELAAALGAEVVHTPPVDGRPLHLHVTDRLFGPSPEAAARALARICRACPTTLTLHDVPQPSDGASFTRRVAAYASVVEAAVDWVVCSRHERTLLMTHSLGGGDERGAVIPLPVVSPMPSVPVPASDLPVVAVAGWVYPSKGYREVIEAAAALDRRVEVVALGAVSPGHEDALEKLAGLADEVGVRWRVTGPLDEATMTASMRTAAVGVAAHRNLSASGSLNTWIAAGRRPLVRRSAYTREMAELRPGTLTVFDEGHLSAALAQALRQPVSTVLGPDAVTAPHLADVAAAYAAWWPR